MLSGPPRKRIRRTAGRSYLHFPIVPCHGGTMKKWGHNKKKFPALCPGICAPTFGMLPAPLLGSISSPSGVRGRVLAAKRFAHISRTQEGLSCSPDTSVVLLLKTASHFVGKFWVEGLCFAPIAMDR